MVVISILVWDTPEYAEKLLANLFSECPAGQTPHLVYVLDQGSGGRTRRVLNRYRKQIRLLRVKENIGFPAGHNFVFKTAMEAEPFDAFCVLNSDVRFQQNHWLDALNNALNEDERNAVAGPLGNHVLTGTARRGHGKTASPQDTTSGNYDFLSGCISLIRTSVALEHGLYDEAFTPGYFEDADMGYRYHTAGYRSVYCPLAFEHTYLGPRTSTAKQNKENLSNRYGDFRERNRERFVSRWGHLFPPEG